MDAGNIFSLSLGLCDFLFFLVFRGAELGTQGRNQGRPSSLDIRVGVAWMRVSILRVKAEST